MTYKKNNDNIDLMLDQGFIFPSIKSLLDETWEVFKKSILNLFLLVLVNIALLIAFVLAILVLSLIFGFGIGVFSSLKNFDPSALSSISPILLIGIALLFLVVFVLFLLASSALSIASITIVAEYKNRPSIGEVIRRSFSRVIPLALTSLLLFFFYIGGLFALFLPVILFYFFFMFAPFEVILNNKKNLKAIKSSVQIVSQNFGEILVRILLYIFGYLFIIIFIPNLIKLIEPQTGQILEVITLFFGSLIGWFGLAYSITLYKHAKKATNPEKSFNFTWVWLTTAAGWLLFCVSIVFAFFLIGKLDKSGGLDNLFKKKTEEMEETESILSFAPSSCGLSIPIPKTTDTFEDQERKWLFEEISLNTEQFYILDNDVHPVNNLLGSFIAYKEATARLGGEGDFSIAYPGLNIFCVDNTKSLTLEEYKNLALANKNFKVTAEKQILWGEVELIPVWIEGEFKDQPLKEPAYLGVSKDGNRLFYIKIWAISEDDPLKETLKKDSDIIIKNLKYREVKDKLSEAIPPETQQAQPSQGTTTPPAPSCTQFTIREGEFISDKCYSQKDHDDLSYYINRFNSAVFSYNGAISSMDITCDGGDFFKDSCEQSEQQKQTAEGNMNNYRGIIQGIIAKGI